MVSIHVWIVISVIIWYLDVGPGVLRAPAVVPDKAKMAIVFTYFSPFPLHPLRDTQKANLFSSPHILAFFLYLVGLTKGFILLNFGWQDYLK